MTALLWIGMLAAAFAGCRWSGRTLDRHYADRLEIVAVLLIAVCVFAPLAIASATTLADELTLKVTLAVAVCGGLFSGRGRTMA
jgi:hypothetical protein